MHQVGLLKHENRTQNVNTQDNTEEQMIPRHFWRSKKDYEESGHNRMSYQLIMPPSNKPVIINAEYSLVNIEACGLRNPE